MLTKLLQLFFLLRFIATGQLEMKRLTFEVIVEIDRHTASGGKLIGATCGKM